MIKDEIDNLLALHKACFVGEESGIKRDTVRVGYRHDEASCNRIMCQL